MRKFITSLIFALAITGADSAHAGNVIVRGVTDPLNVTNFLSRAADSASAVHFSIDSSASQTTAGGKLISIESGGTEFFHIISNGGASNFELLFNPSGTSGDRYNFDSTGFIYKPANPTHEAVKIADTGGSGFIDIMGLTFGLKIQSQTSFDSATVTDFVSSGSDSGIVFNTLRVPASGGAAFIVNNNADPALGGLTSTDDLMRLQNFGATSWRTTVGGSTFMGKSDEATVIAVKQDSGKLDMSAAYWDGASEQFTNSDIRHVLVDSPGAQAATGVLTLTVFPLNNETITIDAKVYTWQDVLTNVDGNVLIGGVGGEQTLDNLIAAINLGAGAGTAYAAATTLHPTVSASAGPGFTMDAQAKTAGTGGNSIATTETMTGSSWANATLLGGLDAGTLDSKITFSFDDVGKISMGRDGGMVFSDSDADIIVPRWTVSQVCNNAAWPAGIAQTVNCSNVTTNGGTLLVTFNASGFRTTGGIISAVVQIAGVTRGTVKVLTNEASSHKSMISNQIVVTGLAAGNHTVTVIADGNTNTDSNDFANVTIQELPF